MITNIPTFQGHKGLGTVAVMEDQSQVAIVASDMKTLRKAFKTLVFKGSAPFDRAKVRKVIIVSDKTFLCQPTVR